MKKQKCRKNETPLEHPWITAAKKEYDGRRAESYPSLGTGHRVFRSANDVNHYLRSNLLALKEFMRSAEGKAGLELLRMQDRRIVIDSRIQRKKRTTIALTGRGFMKETGDPYTRKENEEPISFEDVSRIMLFCGEPCDKTHNQVKWIREQINKIADEILHGNESFYP